jgi:hypothetical protein
MQLNSGQTAKALCTIHAILGLSGYPPEAQNSFEFEFFDAACCCSALHFFEFEFLTSKKQA